MSSCLTDSDLHRYHAKEMPTADESRVRAHLAKCSSCTERSAKLVAGQKGLIQELQKAELGEASATVSVERKKAAPTRRPQRIGPYKILEQLGEGGMGTVYLAEQTAPIKRRVALKLIKLGMDTKQVIARFETERQALALMNHPNVAKVLDAGTTEKGRPYFVMEYVKGESITAYCDRHRLTTKERLGLFMQVCHAVQHAHQKGIIHRDLKPSNVLVAVADVAAGAPAGRGKAGAVAAVPKVIDFGVAKATEHKLTERTLFTEQGQLIGTPEYMSPEQAEMNVLDIDTRTDIYSLGVLLYELLVGALPFDPTSLRQAAFAEIQRIIREVEPPKPSTRLSALASETRPSGSGAGRVGTAHQDESAVGTADDNTERMVGGAHPTALTPRSRSGLGSAAEIANKRRTDLSALTKLLRGDLDWITMRAMDKDRTRRYATASEFADDIARHLNHEPVLASPPSAAYRMKKFIRRNKGPVAIAAVFVLLISASAVGFGVLYNSADRARQSEADQRVLAEEQTRIAQAVNDFLNNDLLAAVAPEQQGKDVLMRDVLDTASKAIEGKFDDAPLIEASIRATLGKTYLKLGAYTQAEPHLVRGLEIHRAQLGEEHRSTLGSMHSLAVLYTIQGRLDEAEPLLVKTLGLMRRVLGEAAPFTMGCSSSLAHLYLAQGRLDEAEPLLVKALELSRRVLGEEHRSTLGSMNNLATLYTSQGRFDEAEPLLVKTLGLMRRVLGEEDPFTMNCIVNLANLYSTQGRFDEAEPLCVKTLELNRRVLGEEHPRTLALMDILATLYEQQGRYDEAEPLYVKTLELNRRVLGEEHPHTLGTMQHLSNLYSTQGRFDKAEPLLVKELELSRRVLGEEDRSTLGAMNNLAMLYGRQGRYDEAEPLYVKTLGLMRRVLGEEDPFTMNCMTNLASVYMDQGQYGKAEDLYFQSVEAKRRHLGIRHDLTLLSIRWLAETYELQGRTAEALPLRRELLGYLVDRALAPEADASTLNSAAWELLTGDPQELRDPATALEFAKKAVEATNEQDPSILDTLALAQQMIGDIDTAIETQTKAVALLPPGPSALRSELESNLVKYLLEGQRFAKAEPLLLAMHEQLVGSPPRRDESSSKTQASIERLTKFYESWHAAEPGKGYDAKAAEWRAKLQPGDDAVEPTP